MTPGKLLSEIQVGGAINDARWQLARDAYVEFDPNNRVPDSELVTPDPEYWIGRLSHPSWASGVIARLPFGALNEAIYSYKHGQWFENPFSVPAHFCQANGLRWGQQMYGEAIRAIAHGTEVFWYHGKPGIDLYDSLALDIIKALPGTHIVDATNGVDGRPSWMPDHWWGEAWSDYRDPHGAYCFARNVRTEDGKNRLRLGMAESFYRGNRVISCHEPADFEWLLGTTVAELINDGGRRPTWKILLASGISLAFRGDEQKVNADLGGRLAELREVAS